MFLLSNLLGLPGPQLSVCLLLIYSLIILLTIIWWTDAVVAHTLGWAVALLLFYYGWLFPEIQIAEATGAVTFSGSSIQILISFGLMLGLLVTLYLGVQRQRYGGSPFGIGRLALGEKQTFSIRQFFPGVQSDCPVNSAVKAEIWRERQLRGLHYAITFGALFGLLTIGFFRLVFFRGDFDAGIGAVEIISLSIVFYFGLYAMMQVTTFGVTWRKGVSQVSLFDRTLAMSSARLISIKLIIATIGPLIAGIAMFAVILVLGPVFTSGFDEMRTLVLMAAIDFSSESAYFISTRVVLFLAAFASFTAIYAAFNAWAILKPKEISWVVAGIPVYIFSIVLFAAVTQEPAAREALVASIAAYHSWIFVIGMPLAGVYFVRAVVRDEMLSQNQLIACALLCIGLAVLYLIDLVNTDYLGGDKHLGVRVAIGMLASLPAVAVGLALWTMGRIRHG